MERINGILTHPENIEKVENIKEFMKNKFNQFKPEL